MPRVTIPADRKAILDAEIDRMVEAILDGAPADLVARQMAERCGWSKDEADKYVANILAMV